MTDDQGTQVKPEDQAKAAEPKKTADEAKQDNATEIDPNELTRKELADIADKAGVEAKGSKADIAAAINEKQSTTDVTFPDETSGRGAGLHR